MAENTQSQKKDDSTGALIIGIAVVAIIIVAIFFWYSLEYIPNFEQNHKDLNTSMSGTYGDSFGALTSLFTSLTFLGLLITIVQQQMAYKQQGQELKNALEESSKQTDAFNEQIQKMDDQNFDNKFFNMLKMFTDMRITKESEATTNYKKVVEATQSILYTSIKNKDANIEYISKLFENKNDEIVQLYYLNLYQIIKYTDEYFFSKKITEEKKYIQAKKYINIIRANLTKNELLALMLNAVCIGYILGNYQFKEYLEKYEFCEHADIYAPRFTRWSSDTLEVNIKTIILSQYNQKICGRNNKMITKHKLACEFMQEYYNELDTIQANT